MAKALLLYVIGATLFTNSGQIIKLRWLEVFKDFKAAREFNWGISCLSYIYFIMDAMSQEVYIYLFGHWRLWVVRFYVIQ